VHLRGVTDLLAGGAGPTDEYVAAARLGNRALDRDWITTGELFDARSLTYTLATTPTGWASGSTPPVVG
jgi:putative alpha-1,2-mannosidase